MNTIEVIAEIAVGAGLFGTIGFMFHRARRDPVQHYHTGGIFIPPYDETAFVRSYNKSRNVRTALDAVNECQRRRSSPSPGADGPSGDGATAARPTPFHLTIDASGCTSREQAERIRRYMMPEQLRRNPADVLADMGVERDGNWQALHDYLEEPSTLYWNEHGDLRRRHSDGTDTAGGIVLYGEDEGEPLPTPPAPNIGGIGNPQYEGGNFVDEHEIALEMKVTQHFGTLPRGEEA